MPSTPVVRRQRLANALRTSLLRHEEALQEGLRERLGPLVGEGEVLDSFHRIHEFFLKLLAAREEAMVTADEEHLAEKMDDRNPRRLRREAADEVHDILVGIRRAANGHFGTEAATEFLNIEGRTSRDPVIAYRQGTRVMERLRSTELALPASSLTDETPDREGWAARLEPALAALQNALDTVGQEEREFALTQAAKEIAVDDYDQDSGALARILEGYMILAGRRDLSEEVRPGRLRRRAQAAAEAEEETGEESPEGEAPAQTESPEPPPAAGGGSAPPRRPGTGS